MDCPKCGIRLKSVGGRNGYFPGKHKDVRIRVCDKCGREYETEEVFKTSTYQCDMLFDPPILH